MKLGDALAQDPSLLPAEWAGAAWCENYEFRAGACARTWARPHAQDNLMCALRACSRTAFEPPRPYSMLPSSLSWRLIRINADLWCPSLMACCQCLPWLLIRVGRAGRAVAKEQDV